MINASSTFLVLDEKKLPTQKTQQGATNLAYPSSDLNFNLNEISYNSGRSQKSIQNVIESSEIPTKKLSFLARNFAKIYQTGSTNQIRTTKYHMLDFLPKFFLIFTFIPKNIFEQMRRIANCFFVFIAVMNFCPEIQAVDPPILGVLPISIVLLATIIKDSFDEYARLKNDKIVNNSNVIIYNKLTKKYENTKWKDIRNGDILLILEHENIPADVVLLNSFKENEAGELENVGYAFLATTNLDGETNLKQKKIVKGISSSHANLLVQKLETKNSAQDIKKFTGRIFDLDQISQQDPTRPVADSELNSPNLGIKLDIDNLLLRGCTLKNVSFIEAMVINTGKNCKVMQSTKNLSRRKMSKVEQILNYNMIFILMILILLCCIVGGMNLYNANRYNGNCSY